MYIIYVYIYIGLPFWLTSFWGNWSRSSTSWSYNRFWGMVARSMFLMCAAFEIGRGGCWGTHYVLKLKKLWCILTALFLSKQYVISGWNLLVLAFTGAFEMTALECICFFSSREKAGQYVHWPVSCWCLFSIGPTIVSPSAMRLTPEIAHLMSELRVMDLEPTLPPWAPMMWLWQSKGICPIQILPRLGLVNQLCKAFIVKTWICSH